MKRILIFSLAYYPHVGGAEVALKELTDRLTDIEFMLITLRMEGEPTEERMGNVQLYRAGNGDSYLSKILFIPRAAYLAVRLHQARPFDALWAMMSYMLFPIVLLRIVGVRLPYLLTLQDGDPFERVFRRPHILPFLPLLRYGFRRAAAVQTISTHLAGWARRMGFTGPLEVIPNGVDVARFTGAPIPHEGTVLITTSRLVRKNAVDDVLRALPLVPHTRFRILGTGPDETALRRLAKSLGVEDRVEFVGHVGHVGHVDLPRYLHTADIFVRPSRSEGMGNSFIEAMAAGLPVIGTQEGGIVDFLFDGETGWVVDKDSPEQIAEAIENILANPEKVKRVTENARTLVQEKYEWCTIAKQMQGILDRVLAAR